MQTGREWSQAAGRTGSTVTFIFAGDFMPGGEQNRTEQNRTVKVKFIDADGVITVKTLHSTICINFIMTC